MQCNAVRSDDRKARRALLQLFFIVCLFLDDFDPLDVNVDRMRERPRVRTALGVLWAASVHSITERGSTRTVGREGLSVPGRSTRVEARR